MRSWVFRIFLRYWVRLWNSGILEAGDDENFLRRLRKTIIFLAIWGHLELFKLWRRLNCSFFEFTHQFSFFFHSYSGRNLFFLKVFQTKLIPSFPIIFPRSSCFLPAGFRSRAIFMSLSSSTLRTWSFYFCFSIWRIAPCPLASIHLSSPSALCDLFWFFQIYSLVYSLGL